MREKIRLFRYMLHEIIETTSEHEAVSSAYAVFMLITIFASLFPLVFKETNSFFVLIDNITVTIFIVDYAFRLITADYKLKKGLLSFLIYPFTGMAIIDLLAILPSFSVLSATLKSLKLFRMVRTFRALRAMKVAKAFKVLRYSKSLDIILRVIHDQKTPLAAVGTLAIGYLLIAALVIFNVEPDTFGNYFDAIYWATVSLTTMGYGDIYAVSIPGRIVTMLSSFVGIAIVALPSGIITAGYLDALQKQRDENEDE